MNSIIEMMATDCNSNNIFIHIICLYFSNIKTLTTLFQVKETRVPKNGENRKKIFDRSRFDI
jgi:hypothetical protein